MRTFRYKREPDDGDASSGLVNLIYRDIIIVN